MPRDKRQLTTTSTDDRSRYLKSPADGKIVYFLSLEDMKVYGGRWCAGWGQMRWLKQKRVYHIRSKAVEDLNKVKDVLA
jgi:hypothetical protein